LLLRLGKCAAFPNFVKKFGETPPIPLIPMLIREFLGLIESEFPADTAMEGDPIGLQLQSERKEITSVLTTLEINEETVSEAVRLGTDCIVTFHPLIYRPLRTITENDFVGRLVTRLIGAGIAVIAVHTNYDAHPRGTNAIFGRKLGLLNMAPLLPDAHHAGFGMGIIGSLPVNVGSEELAEAVGNICGAPVIFVPKNGQDRIATVAAVCGSGFTFLDYAIAAGADAFITADVKYHGYRTAAEHCTLISPGHYEMERFVPEYLAGELQRLVNDSIAIAIAETTANPLRYIQCNSTVADDSKT